MLPYILGGVVLAIAAVVAGCIVYQASQMPKVLPAMRIISGFQNAFLLNSAEEAEGKSTPF